MDKTWRAVSVAVRRLNGLHSTTILYGNKDIRTDVHRSLLQLHQPGIHTKPRTRTNFRFSLLAFASFDRRGWRTKTRLCATASPNNSTVSVSRLTELLLIEGNLQSPRACLVSSESLWVDDDELCVQEGPAVFETGEKPGRGCGPSSCDAATGRNLLRLSAFPPSTP